MKNYSSFTFNMSVALIITLIVYLCLLIYGGYIMFNKIRGYFKKMKQEKKKNQELIKSNCACVDCSYFENCLKGEKAKCFLYNIRCSFIDAFLFVIFTFLFMSGLYFSVANEFLDKGFTLEQIADMLIK